MQFFYKYIDQLIPEEIRKVDSIHYRRYRTLYIFQILVFPTLGFYIFDNISKNLVITNYSLCTFFVLNLVSLFFIRKNNYKIAANIYTFGLFLALYGTNFANAFDPSSQLAWFFLFPLIPSVLLGGRMGFNWTISSITIVPLSIYIAHANGYHQSEYTEILLLESSLADLLVGPFLVYILSQAALNIREIVIDQLESSKNEINQAYLDKREVLSILFHDLSNHLTVSSIHLKSVTKNGVYDEDKITKAHHSIEQMNKIIESVRMLEKIKAGKAALILGPVNLEEIIEEAKYVFEKKLKDKQIKICFYKSENISKWVLAEKVSLTNNILYNAISNAIKFSRENSQITIRLEASETDYAQIIIEDHGIGIPNSLLKDVFKFDKATSREGTNGEKGTGFGFPIMYSTIQRFQGKVTIESQSLQDGHKESFTKIKIQLKSVNLDNILENEDSKLQTAS